MSCPLCGNDADEVIEVFGQHIETQQACRKCILEEQKRRPRYYRSDNIITAWEEFLYDIRIRISSRFTAERIALQWRWSGGTQRREGAPAKSYLGGAEAGARG